MITMTQYYVGAKPKQKLKSLYLTMEEKRNIITILNTTAVYLLEYYLSVIVRKNFIITDIKTSAAIGLSLRAVRDNRRLLIKHNLFYECKTKNHNTTIYLYCAGKEGVYSKKYFDTLFSCESIPQVYYQYTEKEINIILANASLSAMVVNDINCLLCDFHNKAKGTKRQNYKW